VAASFAPFASWVPRVLTLCFACFLALFAVDVVGDGLGVWQTLGVVALHLIPAAIVLVVLAVAWHRELAGAIAYFTLALGYLLVAGGRVHWSAIAVISGSLALLGTLFLIAWLSRPRGGAPAAG